MFFLRLTELRRHGAKPGYYSPVLDLRGSRTNGSAHEACKSPMHILYMTPRIQSKSLRTEPRYAYQFLAEGLLSVQPQRACRDRSRANAGLSEMPADRQCHPPAGSQLCLTSVSAVPGFKVQSFWTFGPRPRGVVVADVSDPGTSELRYTGRAPC